MIRTILFLCIFLFVIGRGYSQQKRIISFQDAIQIALGESYTFKYYQQDMAATYYSYLYTKAQFKPYLDIDLYAPSWSEQLTQINQADGLPVYNTAGSLQVGGKMNFTYVLPTGGNFAFTSRMYWENYSTIVSLSGNKELEQKQVYSRFALSFNQPIFTANKLRENMKIAELRNQRSEFYFTRVQMDIIYNVTFGFYNVYELEYEYHINQERLKNSKEAYRITKLKQETGNLPEGELLIAEITVAQNEVRLMESEGKLESAKDDFKLLIGLPLEEEIELKAEMEFETFLVDISMAIQEALKNRKELQEERIDIELQKIQLKQAKRERELKGNISAYYDFTGLSTRENGGVGQLIHSSFDNMMDRPANRGVTFTLSYPIADWGRMRNQVRREEARLIQYNLDLENIERKIEKEIREIVRTVKEAEKRYRINQQNREIALKSYQISQMRFENGDMTSQELSIEQERLSQVQLAYIESYITYKLAVANLNRKTMYDFEHNRSYFLQYIN